MVYAAFYSKDKNGNYTNHVESAKFNNEKEASLRAKALNWAYSIIAEF